MKSHRFDPWSFIFGLVIVLIGAFFLTTTNPIDLANRLDTALELGLPILALAIGAALVIPVFRRTKPVTEPTAAPMTTEETAAMEELNQTVPPLS
jgi:hypothetical protein